MIRGAFGNSYPWGTGKHLPRFRSPVYCKHTRHPVRPRGLYHMDQEQHPLEAAAKGSNKTFMKAYG